MAERRTLTQRRTAGNTMPAESATQLAAWLDDIAGPMWHAHAPGSVPGLPEHLVLTQYVDDATGRRIIAGLLLLHPQALTAEAIKKIPLAALENRANLGTKMFRELAKLPPLVRDGHSPEAWAELVARHYVLWARHVPNPVAAMAERWQANPNTVHSWVHEARLRGLLPPAVRGKRKARS